MYESMTLYMVNKKKISKAKKKKKKKKVTVMWCHPDIKLLTALPRRSRPLDKYAT